jgi:hypothetical protein
MKGDGTMATDTVLNELVDLAAGRIMTAAKNVENMRAAGLDPQSSARLLLHDLEMLRKINIDQIRKLADM